jgi:hypothetical protein
VVSSTRAAALGPAKVTNGGLPALKNLDTAENAERPPASGPCLRRDRDEPATEIACQSCGGRVSTFRFACRHCGGRAAPPEKTRELQFQILLVMLVLAFLAAWQVWGAKR